jgi:formylglycine-generating enzyme required for sulfatase activity
MSQKAERFGKTFKRPGLTRRSWVVLLAAAFALLIGFLLSTEPHVDVSKTSRAGDYRAGETFKDCAVCPEMLVIPAGEFTMGSPSSEEGRFENEGPQHRVTIGKELAVGKYEITVGEFSQFVADTGYVAKTSCHYWNGSKWGSGTHYSWEDPGFQQTSSEPAVCITWSDAKAYVDWLADKTGKGYRLMSEAEWEYAARAGATSPRPWGTDLSHNDANFGEEQCCQPSVQGRDQGKYTAPAGSFTPNRFGLYDMIGNVWEWVDDCWNENYVDAPTDGSSWQSGDCEKRIIRGASWYSDPRRVRSAMRYAFRQPVNRTKVGFRVCRDL